MGKIINLGEYLDTANNTDTYIISGNITKEV